MVILEPVKIEAISPPIQEKKEEPTINASLTSVISEILKDKGKSLSETKEVKEAPKPAAKPTPTVQKDWRDKGFKSFKNPFTN